MIKEYHQSLKKHLKGFAFFTTIFIIGAAIVIYLRVTLGWDADVLLMEKFICGFLLFSFLPVIYLYFEYLHCNKVCTSFKIDCLRKEITYTDKDKAFVFRFDEILKVVIHGTPSWTRADRVQVLPFEHYHYARIFLKNDEDSIVTCLVVDDLFIAIQEIPDVKIEYRLRIFPSILIE